MAEYYAVERSQDYLMHYGIRGMKWGVRKAIERGSDRKLSRQYIKAQKKLAKLNDRADIKKQQERSTKYNKAAKASATLGGTTLGLLAGGSGAYHLSKLLGAKYSEKSASALNNANTSDLYNVRRLYDRAADHYEDIADKHFKVKNKLYGLHYDVGPALAGGAIGALGYSAYSKMKSNAAKNRTTAKGHAKAVAKRDEFQREMNRVFAGTKYGKKKRK